MNGCCFGVTLEVLLALVWLEKYLKSLFISNYLIVFQQEVTFSIPLSGTHGISLFIYQIDLLLKSKNRENTVFCCCFLLFPRVFEVLLLDFPNTGWIVCMLYLVIIFKMKSLSHLVPAPYCIASGVMTSEILCVCMW